MKYRLIKFKEFRAEMNMALDEAILERVIKGVSPPTIRFYGWNPGSVTIGNFQGIEQEVNVEKCKREGISIVRRITGGGSVYHDPIGEVTYTIIAPEKDFPRGIVDSYQEICGYIVQALSSLGIKAVFKPINDVHIEGRKVSGSAQTRKQGVLLQHGTILLSVDEAKLVMLLMGRKDKYDEKLTKSVKKRITSVKEHCKASKQELIRALEKAFGEGKDIVIGDYSGEELRQAEKLAKMKYSTEEWNYKR